MTRAKQAAGGETVLVHGAGTAQLELAAGVLDELEFHLIPVLFGQGRRLFDNLARDHIELETPGSSTGSLESHISTTGSSVREDFPGGGDGPEESLPRPDPTLRPASAHAPR
jgi:dihydrofolate reductase